MNKDLNKIAAKVIKLLQDEGLTMSEAKTVLDKVTSSVYQKDKRISDELSRISKKYISDISNGLLSETIADITLAATRDS